ncbi:MAG: hypothetical protein PF444_00440 [Bacteroidales bacterium]|nr:hypothetical protein [Bacteroidales bacterium]
MSVIPIIYRDVFQNNKKGKYTDRGIPWISEYSEVFSSKMEAADREKEIKSKKAVSPFADVLSIKILFLHNEINSSY